MLAPGSYAEICSRFVWQVPAKFNIGVAVCDRWATGESGPALIYEDPAGNVRTFSFDELKLASPTCWPRMGSSAAIVSVFCCRNVRKRFFPTSPSTRWARWPYRCSRNSDRRRSNIGCSIAPGHGADHGEADEGSDRCCVALEIAS
jgi:hypothetical protein